MPTPDSTDRRHPAARAALRELFEVLSRGVSNPLRDNLIAGCRPLLEPSDAERKLERIEELIGPMLGIGIVHELRQILWPRPIQAGDPVTWNRQPDESFFVADILEDGAVLRLKCAPEDLGFCVRSSDCERPHPMEES